MGGQSPEEIRKETRTYIMVFAALAVLTIVTVAISYLNLSAGPAVFLAMVELASSVQPGGTTVSPFRKMSKWEFLSQELPTKYSSPGSSWRRAASQCALRKADS